MCYQKCRYEDYDGECTLRSGVKPPIDAMCSIGERVVENDHLRDLVRDTWQVMWACAEERCQHRTNGCFRIRGNYDDPRTSGECWFENRFKELGIEVDA